MSENIIYFDNVSYKYSTFGCDLPVCDGVDPTASGIEINWEEVKKPDYPTMCFH